MQAGLLLTYGTIYLALCLYVAALALRLCACGRHAWLQASRLAWTIGFIAYAGHVLAAFAFVHHLSHDAAYRATAQRTAEVTGWDWGGGLYANYLFTLVWFADVVWWWRGLEVYQRRPKVVASLIQGFLAFIAFNATVVFGHGAVQVAGGLCSGLLFVLWLRI